MAKRKRLIKMDKLIKEGRGQGIGAEYKPWIRIQDVPSLGRATRLKGIKTKRQHEFLSDMEKNYFYFLEYSDSVIDIREQYPLLPIDETISIAKELGIRHPKNPKTGEYVVMSTDFLLTISNKNKVQEVARTIKSTEDLIKRRTIEKFEIERVYWKKKDIDWGIVTEKEIDKIIAQNIGYIHSYYDITQIDSFKNIEKMELEDLIFEYIKRIVDTDKTIRNISTNFDKEMSLAKGSGIVIFKYLLARKIIDINLKKTLDIDNNIEIRLNKPDVSMELNVL